MEGDDDDIAVKVNGFVKNHIHESEGITAAD